MIGLTKLYESRLNRRNVLVCGLDPSRRSDNVRFRRSPRIAKKHENEANGLLKRLHQLSISARDERVASFKIVSIGNMYKLLHDQYIPCMSKYPFNKLKMYKLIYAGIGRIPHLENTTAMWIDAESLTSEQGAQFIHIIHQYRKLASKYLTEHYYKLWLLKKILPYDLYRIVSSYYGY
jgi:hypothetical protein